MVVAVAQSPDTVPAPDAVWRLSSNDGLVYRTIGSEILVFQRATSHTHVLDEVAGLVLREVEHRAGSTTDLAERVARQLDMTPTDGLDATVANALAMLRSVELIDADAP